jgi:hypothetical protein
MKKTLLCLCAYIGSNDSKVNATYSILVQA